MKLVLTLLLLVGGLTTFAQNSIDGNWKGTRETPNGTFEVNYTFKVEGFLNEKMRLPGGRFDALS